MVSWEFFCKRRGYSLAGAIISLGLDDYGKLKKFCKDRGIVAPTEREFGIANRGHEKAVAPEPPPKISEPPKKVATKKKPTRRRPRKKQE